MMLQRMEKLKKSFLILSCFWGCCRFHSSPKKFLSDKNIIWMRNLLLSFLYFLSLILHSFSPFVFGPFLNRCLLTYTLPLINFFFFSFYYFSMTLFYLFKSFSSFQSIYLFSILLLSLHSFYYVIIFLIIVFLSFSLTYNIYSSRLVLQCHNPECKWHQTNSSFSLVPSCLEHQHFLLAFKFAPQDVIIMDSCRTPSNKSRCSDIKQVTLRLFAFIQPVIESFFSVHESYSAFLQSTKKTSLEF